MGYQIKYLIMIRLTEALKFASYYHSAVSNGYILFA